MIMQTSISGNILQTEFVCAACIVLYVVQIITIHIKPFIFRYSEKKIVRNYKQSRPDVVWHKPNKIKPVN